MRKKNSNRDKRSKLGSGLSYQELPRSGKPKSSSNRQSCYSASPEPPEEFIRTMGSSRWSHLLNLQIPVTSPSMKKNSKRGHRANQSTRLQTDNFNEDRTSDLTKMIKGKHTLLQKVTILQQKIQNIKTSNKELKANLAKIKKVEHRIAEACREQEFLKHGLETEKPGSLAKNMEMFKLALTEYLQHE